MTSAELKAKMEAAQAKVEKIKKTIERHEKGAEKKLAVLTKNGWLPNPSLYRGASYDAYWAACEYESKLDDIKTATRKLADAEKVVQNWQAKYEKARAQENKIETTLPEILKEMRDQLTKIWTKADIEKRTEMRQVKSELDYMAFRKEYSFAEEESLNKTDEQFEMQNRKEAELWVWDLYNRVIAEVGEVTDFSGIRFRGKALNGFVRGTKGAVNVETILAGGYNIQKLHMRVILHKA